MGDLFQPCKRMLRPYKFITARFTRAPPSTPRPWSRNTLVPLSVLSVRIVVQTSSSAKHMSMNIDLQAINAYITQHHKEENQILPRTYWLGHLPPGPAMSLAGFFSKIY